MKSILYILFFIFISLQSFCQRTKLEASFEGDSLPITKKMVYDFRLYFEWGYGDTVNVYLNKKLIRSQYVMPLQMRWHNDYRSTPEIRFPISFKKGNNLLEIKKKVSGVIYYCYIKRGYVWGRLDLRDRPSILYTNRERLSE
jgi:hypothetical protein